MRTELGTNYLGPCCSFQVWAPRTQQLDLQLLGPENRCRIPMHSSERGYFHVSVDGLAPGSRYLYCLDSGQQRPDPASRFQAEGVHGPSQVVDLHFDWEDQTWKGLPLQAYLIYELHVGTFTDEGTFDAAISQLDALRDLGITAIELMPVAQFPGNRNWGYDGVYPYAVQNSYGGPLALKRLVQACHQRGMVAVLDVVYNHLGPEGNYLGEFGYYFTDRYRTPWGDAINFGGGHSDEVRRFFIENALYWITEFHFDALRLDAVHAIFDASAWPFLAELSEAVHRRGEELQRHVYVIPESSLNDVRLIRPREQGGCGCDAQWSDDFHHSLHTLLTGERTGYYQDFGTIEHLVKAWREGYVYTGQYSQYRQRRHGNSSHDVPLHRLVVCAQNHDQVGNRKLGERLSQLVSFEGLKLAAAAVLLSPCLPLLFMGEEYGETAPFLYFISHSDLFLVEAVRLGRKKEFAAFEGEGETPDPQSEFAFERSKLNRRLLEEPKHRLLREFYQELIHLRRTLPALRPVCKENLEVIGFEEEKVVFLGRGRDAAQVFALFSFGGRDSFLNLPLETGLWTKLLDSEDPRWKLKAPALDSRANALPRTILSKGTVKLALPGKAMALFGKAGQ
jgi:maltooligosyltrehalose trehalohydrolase